MNPIYGNSPGFVEVREISELMVMESIRSLTRATRESVERAQQNRCSILDIHDALGKPNIVALHETLSKLVNRYHVQQKDRAYNLTDIGMTILEKISPSR